MVEVEEGARRERAMKPQCYMVMLYLNWVVYLGVIAWAGLTGRYFLSLAWALGFPAFLLVYMAVFPRFSRALGYGSVEDEPASREPAAGGSGEAEPGGETGKGTGSGRGAGTVLPEVTLYKAVGCPFCPIVERRLDELEAKGGFTLRKLDVTMRPGILASQGIKAVPVVAAGEESIVGHATSRKLADLIQRAGRPPSSAEEPAADPGSAG